MKAFEIKTVKTRDQATSILRKMGMKKENYSRFIVKSEITKTFEVDVTSAENFLRPPIKPLTAKDKKKATKIHKDTIASVIRFLVGKGQTNEEIWSVIQPQFNLSDDKKWYPGWYRAADIRRAA